MMVKLENFGIICYQLFLKEFKKFFLGIGGAAVVALYRLAYSDSKPRTDLNNNINEFKSDPIFDEIKQRALQVN